MKTILKFSTIDEDGSEGPARLRCCLSEDVMVDVAETKFTVPSQTFTSFPVDEFLSYAKTRGGAQHRKRHSF